jgi:hypothetical protein
VHLISFVAANNHTTCVQLMILLMQCVSNGFPCKDAKDVVAEDFFFLGLHLAGNTTNK